MLKKIPIILICIAALCLNGCLVKKIPLNDAELDAVAQYSADALLRHDSNYQNILLNSSVLTPTPTNTPKPTPTNTPTPTPRPTPTPIDPNATPTPTPTPTNTPTPTPFPSNNAETWKQLAKVIGAEDFNVMFAGASIPESTFSLGDSVLALPHTEGYDYLAVKIVIKNDSSETRYLKTYDMFEEDGLTMQHISLLMINGTYFDYETTTFFMNDLKYIGLDSEDPRGEPIASGARYNGVNGAILVFKVPEGIDIDTAGLLITNKNNDSVIIKIQ